MYLYFSVQDPTKFSLEASVSNLVNICLLRFLLYIIQKKDIRYQIRNSLDKFYRDQFRFGYSSYNSIIRFQVYSAANV